MKKILVLIAVAIFAAGCEKEKVVEVEKIVEVEKLVDCGYQTMPDSLKLLLKDNGKLSYFNSKKDEFVGQYDVVIACYGKSLPYVSDYYTTLPSYVISLIGYRYTTSNEWSTLALQQVMVRQWRWDNQEVGVGGFVDPKYGTTLKTNKDFYKGQYIIGIFRK